MARRKAASETRRTPLGMKSTPCRKPIFDALLLRLFVVYF